MAFRFANRQNAGRLLALALEHYKDDPSVVIYALPRGGVVLGYEVAQTLHAPLTLVIARKIGHPSNEEFAIGAVTETGEPMIDRGATAFMDPSWLDRAIAKSRDEAVRRRELYLAGQPPLPATDKIAILVDDGVATGHTIRAAIRELRDQDPRKIVVAVPVAPPEILRMLEQESDVLVVLDPGEDYLGSVGAYYDAFPQVTDAEVTNLLQARID